MSGDAGRERAPFGLAAEFTGADALVDAAWRVRDAGYNRVDAFSPYPVDGLEEALGIRERRIAWIVLGGALFGAAVGLGIQIYANLAYPLNVGGRAVLPFEAFSLITVVMLLLFAVLFGFVGMFVLDRLPRLNHPVFDIPGFHRATSDRFFLVVLREDERFDLERTRKFLAGLDAERISVVADEEVAK